MAYKAKTLNAPPNEPNAYAGFRAPPRVVGGIEVPSHLKTLPGDPPEELLKDDRVDVQALAGHPWPGSSCDRNSRSPGAWQLKQVNGQWPTDREKALQEFAEAKLKNPEGVATKVLKDQGYNEDEVRKVIARSRASTRNIPDLSESDPPKRGPGRPRKTSEE